MGKCDLEFVPVLEKEKAKSSSSSASCRLGLGKGSEGEQRGMLGQERQNNASTHALRKARERFLSLSV